MGCFAVPSMTLQGTAAISVPGQGTAFDMDGVGPPGGNDPATAETSVAPGRRQHLTGTENGGQLVCPPLGSGS